MARVGCAEWYEMSQTESQTLGSLAGCGTCSGLYLRNEGKPQKGFKQGHTDAPETRVYLSKVYCVGGE